MVNFNDKKVRQFIGALKKGNTDWVIKELEHSLGTQVGAKKPTVGKVVYGKEVKDFNVKAKAEEFRSGLVKNQTPAEARFKAYLKSEKIEYSFQKIFYYQKGMGGTSFYIVDFYIPELSIVVEIDGEYHARKTQKTLDKTRTRVLKSSGVSQVIRLSNENILEDSIKMKTTLEWLKDKADPLIVEDVKYKRKGKNE